jgi:hypothetical protein
MWTQTGKGTIQGPTANRTRELLGLNRDRTTYRAAHRGLLTGLLTGLTHRTTHRPYSQDLLIGLLTGLLTGQCHLKGHLFKLGKVNSPRCEKGLEK